MALLQPIQHTRDDTLLRHAAGQLSRGASLIVATHVAVCARCAARVLEYETVGGIMLHDLPPTPLNDLGMARLLSQLDRPHVSTATRPRSGHHRAKLSGAAKMPAALEGYDIGPWRFLAPGMSRSKVRMPHRGDGNVFLLRASRGTAFPVHTHRGVEYTCILTGSFSDSTGRYQVGDMAEVDDALVHQPVVDSVDDCICLIAIDGHLQLQTRLGRWLQPFMGI